MPMHVNSLFVAMKDKGASLGEYVVLLPDDIHVLVFCHMGLPLHLLAMAIKVPCNT